MRRLDQSVVVRVREALHQFATAGQGDVRPLEAIDRRWRLRVGDWRVLFSEAGEIMEVIRVSPRGTAYD